METILAEFQTELNSTDLAKRDNKQNDKKLFAMFDLSLRENQTKPKEKKKTKLCQCVDINALHIQQHLILIKIQEQTLETLLVWFQIQRFHAKSSENFTFLEEISSPPSLTDTQTNWRYCLSWWAFSTCSSWKRWALWPWWKKAIIMGSCLVRPVSCVSLGLALIFEGVGETFNDRQHL